MMAVREKGLASSVEHARSFLSIAAKSGRACVCMDHRSRRSRAMRSTELEIDEESFSRPFQVESIDDDRNVRLVAPAI